MMGGYGKCNSAISLLKLEVGRYSVEQRFKRALVLASFGTVLNTSLPTITLFPELPVFLSVSILELLRRHALWGFRQTTILPSCVSIAQPPA